MSFAELYKTGGCEWRNVIPEPAKHCGRRRKRDLLFKNDLNQRGESRTARPQGGRTILCEDKAEVSIALRKELRCRGYNFRSKRTCLDRSFASSFHHF
jgi:hypothetical protein